MKATFFRFVRVLRDVRRMAGYAEHNLDRVEISGRRVGRRYWDSCHAAASKPHLVVTEMGDPSLFARCTLEHCFCSTPKN